ncbi:MAG: hypothetical protein JXA19_05170 [Anaerolineales bacterium]|nr:hypothetical protein [Anaerolineales bacterium]
MKNGIFTRTVYLGILLMVLITAGCQGGKNVPESAAPTQTLAEIIPTIFSAPSVEGAARKYLDAWGTQDYASMYAQLTTISQGAISQEEFFNRYEHVFTEANLSSVTYEILSTLTNPQTARAGYQVTLHSSIVGDITRDTSMELRKEGDEWKVVWDDKLILPELASDNRLSMDRYIPQRGALFDQFGNAIAINTTAVAVAVVPSVLEEGDISGLVSQLATLTGINSNTIVDEITADDAPYLVPIAVVSQDEWNLRKDYIIQYGAVSYYEYDTRLYYGGAAGPQTVGFVGSVPGDDLDAWIARGRTADSIVGRMGIESWAEDYLAGNYGGALYVIGEDNTIQTQLAKVESTPADLVYTTLDRDLQLAAQKAMGDFTGAIVAVELDTGRVLAMVSSPGFDPNDADFNNPNSNWTAYVTDPENPFLNRATSGQYPPGSIFKVITASAALESGLYTPYSSLYCDSSWIGPDGREYDDWTKEKGLAPSGELNLLQGIMRSCNPWFYEIGISLFSWQDEDFSHLIADMARGFGLGQETGIGILPEEPGNIVDPGDEDNPAGEAIQQGIGQGVTLITPIQAAMYVAAIGNGGTLYQPQLIEKIETTEGNVIMQFEPIVNGTLPISESTLTNIQTGMRMVIEDPRGTAYRRFPNFSINIAGKTGTAQNTQSNGDPHAWFIGYVYGEREDRPNIAVAVLVENIGDGSEFAAPIFKRILEVYYYGKPSSIYPWESQIGVVDETYWDEVEEEDTTDETVIEIPPAN